MSTYNAEKLHYTTEEWEQLTQTQRQAVMRRQKQYKSRNHTGKSQRKRLRKRLMIESENQAKEDIPEYEELMSKHRMLSNQLSALSSDSSLRTDLLTLGFEIQAKLHQPMCGCYPASECTCEPDDNDISVTVSDTFKGHLEDSEFYLDQEVKMIEFVKKITQQRIDYSNTRQQLREIARKLDQVKSQYNARVKKLFDEKFSQERK